MNSTEIGVIRGPCDATGSCMRTSTNARLMSRPAPVDTNAHVYLFAALIILPSVVPQSYQSPSVINRTSFAAQVEVRYAACRSDRFNVPASSTAKATARRGACLITSVNATLNGTTTTVTSFTSRGTSASSFVIAPPADAAQTHTHVYLASDFKQ